jgi:hypothetical protein
VETISSDSNVNSYDVVALLLSSLPSVSPVAGISYARGVLEVERRGAEWQGKLTSRSEEKTRTDVTMLQQTSNLRRPE